MRIQRGQNIIIQQLALVSHMAEQCFCIFYQWSQVVIAHWTHQDIHMPEGRSFKVHMIHAVCWDTAHHTQPMWTFTNPACLVWHYLNINQYSLSVLYLLCLLNAVMTSVECFLILAKTLSSNKKQPSNNKLTIHPFCNPSGSIATEWKRTFWIADASLDVFGHRTLVVVVFIFDTL